MVAHLGGGNTRGEKPSRKGRQEPSSHSPGGASVCLPRSPEGAPGQALLFRSNLSFPNASRLSPWAISTLGPKSQAQRELLRSL